MIRKITAKIKPISYDIDIGSSVFETLPQKIESLSPDKTIIVVSVKVFELWRDYLEKVLNKISYVDLLLMEDGEENKNYQYAENFFNKFLLKGLSRKSLVIAIGGGVVGDFAGLLAAFFMRGISIIHVPTTLLAMVDSSLGGKVAVNLKVGKNIIGAFHQPKYILSDILFLKTLPINEWQNGLAEILKHGLIGEQKTLEILKENDLNSIQKKEIISELVYLSAAFKISIVEQDEKEGGLRSILNFGHTIGHAFESFFEYKISHGTAVALGIFFALKISAQKGYLPKKSVAEVNQILNKYELLNKNLKINSAQIINHMKYDKKNFAGQINFVLLEKIGSPLYNQKVDESLLKKILEPIL